MERVSSVTVVGGGLAGSEAAFQLAERCFDVRLFEMRRGGAGTPAHATSDLGELVCSNSLKSVDPLTAGGLLKKELSILGSILIEKAFDSRVPAGNALAVDRRAFSRAVTGVLGSHRRISIEPGEVSRLDPSRPTIVATGPLTSPALSARIESLLGSGNLFFYDAISPIVSDESIDRGRAFHASRYGKGGEDYLNCPLEREEYDRFFRALVEAEPAGRHEFEEERYFEACLPVEVIAGRGRDSLRFGPMRPVGLTNPLTGRRPHAVLQLRREDAAGSMWNLVGFQTRLKRPEQRRVFRMIPALREAEFLRYGSIHRNTFVNTPRVLTSFFQPRTPGWERLIFAGQITGVEGYVESIASGLLAALNIARLASGREPVLPPRTTMLGGLLSYIGSADPGRFQPMNVNFGLLPHPGDGRGREKKKLQADRALADMQAWAREVNA